MLSIKTKSDIVQVYLHDETSIGRGFILSVFFFLHSSKLIIKIIILYTNNIRFCFKEIHSRQTDCMTVLSPLVLILSYALFLMDPKKPHMLMTFWL